MDIHLYSIKPRKIGLIEILLHRVKELKTLVNGVGEQKLSISELLDLTRVMKCIVGFLHYYYVFHRRYKSEHKKEGS